MVMRLNLGKEIGSVGGVGPLAAPFTLTLALSHQGRGDFRAASPPACPCDLVPFARVPFRLERGRGPFVLLPRRSRSYFPWHISPASGGNPAAPPLWVPAFAGMTE